MQSVRPRALRHLPNSSSWFHNPCQEPCSGLGEAAVCRSILLSTSSSVMHTDQTLLCPSHLPAARVGRRAVSAVWAAQLAGQVLAAFNRQTPLSPIIHWLSLPPWPQL